jgi:hypothetical protein
MDEIGLVLVERKPRAIASPADSLSWEERQPWFGAGADMDLHDPLYTVCLHLLNEIGRPGGDPEIWRSIALLKTMFARTSQRGFLAALATDEPRVISPIENPSVSNPVLALDPDPPGHLISQSPLAAHAPPYQHAAPSSVDGLAMAA